MFQFLSNHQFVAGIGTLWVASAAISAMPPPDSAVGKLYRWFYVFSHIIAANLDKTFGKYLPSQSS